MKAGPFTALVLPLVFSSCFGSSAPGLQLPVTYHHQEHSLSCEAAALKMVLDYYGVGVTESEILARMPVDRTPREKGTWGDPDEAFVGDVDGKMGVSGYGIHSKGLQRVSSLWKRTLVIENGRIEDIISQLKLGHPIIVWGYDDAGEELTWTTRAGRKIRALHGEHTRVVYGFRGDPSSPADFLLMDPEVGPVEWPVPKFIENWTPLGRTGIVVLPS